MAAWDTSTKKKVRNSCVHRRECTACERRLISGKLLFLKFFLERIVSAARDVQSWVGVTSDWRSHICCITLFAIRCSLFACLCCENAANRKRSEAALDNCADDSGGGELAFRPASTPSKTDEGFSPWDSFRSLGGRELQRHSVYHAEMWCFHPHRILPPGISRLRPKRGATATLVRPLW